MDQKQIKEFIASKVPEGLSLSQIQDLLKEKGVHITFMELRLLASEIEEEVFKEEEAKEEAKQKKAAPAESEKVLPQEESLPGNETAGLSEEEALPGNDAVPPSGGKTVVELSKLARPGAVASGTVKFGSGVTAEWILDQMGRLGLDKASGKPTQQDIQEFQVELQKLLS